MTAEDGERGGCSDERWQTVAETSVYYFCVLAAGLLVD